MDKDSSHYCYEPYPPTKSTTNSLKRDNDDKRKKKMNIDNGGGGGGDNGGRCQCFGRKHKSKARTFLTGLATNLGICILLFGYTLIGSVIFLAIEGGNSFQQLKTTTTSSSTTTQILATRSMSTTSTTSTTTTTNTNQNGSIKGGHRGGKLLINYSDKMKSRNDEARARTVENIWDITVSLNILYRDNWTRLAAQEITRFQDELMKSLSEELTQQQYRQQQQQQQRQHGEEQPVRKFVQHDHYEWTFAKAFLYSLTVLTTIGYGSIAPRTTLGKTVTMIYAMLGIPLTLLYLSSIGSILSRVARGVFSRALCCCLCSNCGYCCYDEKRMAEKERRMKKKRQQLELQQQQQQQLQEPFYVRSNSLHNNLLHSPQLNDNMIINNSNNICSKEIDNLSCTDNESKTSSMHGLSILAPILLCLAMMFIYICLGTFILYKLENLSILDGFYFCFMSLTTIGFGDMIPGAIETFQNQNNNNNNNSKNNNNNTTIWFCSIYIMSGMALTAMCFNVVHDEIVHRLKHQQHHQHHQHHIHKLLPKLNSQSFPDDLNITDPYNTMTS